MGRLSGLLMPAAMSATVRVSRIVYSCKAETALGAMAARSATSREGQKLTEQVEAELEKTTTLEGVPAAKVKAAQKAAAVRSDF